jgi:hypothetical protein
MTRILLASAFVLGSLVACGSSTSDTPGSSGSPTSDPASCTVAGRTGKSQCQADAPPGFPAQAPVTCSAGTYCVTDASKYEAVCREGCQSDESCGPSERCVKCPGSSTGSCRTCNITDADACVEKPKADAAPPPGTCTRDTFFDMECTAPGKAFQCPSTLEPTGQGTCEQTNLPGVWCCGGAAASCKRDTTVDQSECSRPGPTGPRPPKGYTCDDDKEPKDPKCVQGDLPIHWCCPS